MNLATGNKCPPYTPPVNKTEFKKVVHWDETKNVAYVRDRAVWESDSHSYPSWQRWSLSPCCFCVQVVVNRINQREQRINKTAKVLEDLHVGN